jgi:protein-tyrosine phosphatase
VDQLSKDTIDVLRLSAGICSLVVNLHFFKSVERYVWTVSRLVDDCIDLLKEDRKLYIHCLNGRGRTGTVVAILLGRLYGLSSARAFEYTQALYDTLQMHLPAAMKKKSPNQEKQQEQVRSSASKV